MFLIGVKGHILLPKTLPKDQILGGEEGEAHNQLLHLNTWSEETVWV